MRLDPGLDVFRSKPKVATESVAGESVRMPAARSPVDEGLGHPQELGDIVSGQIARGQGELKLLRGFTGPLPSGRHAHMKAHRTAKVNLANLGFTFDLPLVHARRLRQRRLGNAAWRRRGLVQPFVDG